MKLYCPYCGYESDRASPVGEKAVPTDGDVSICIKCGGVAVFDITHHLLRLPTEIEADEFAHDYRLQEILAAWRDFAQNHPYQKPPTH